MSISAIGVVVSLTYYIFGASRTANIGVQQARIWDRPVGIQHICSTLQDSMVRELAKPPLKISASPSLSYITGQTKGFFEFGVV